MKSISGKKLCKVVERFGQKLARIKGSHYIYTKENVSAIIAQLKQKFGDIAEIDQDVVDYMLVAKQQHWIDLV